MLRWCRIAEMKPGLSHCQMCQRPPQMCRRVRLSLRMNGGKHCFLIAVLDLLWTQPSCGSNLSVQPFQHHSKTDSSSVPWCWFLLFSRSTFNMELRLRKIMRIVCVWVCFRVQRGLCNAFQCCVCKGGDVIDENWPTVKQWAFLQAKTYRNACSVTVIQWCCCYNRPVSHYL